MNSEGAVTATKPRLDKTEQARLVLAINEALGARNRADFVAHFKIESFGQATFNRNIGPSGSFTEEQARAICRAIGKPFDVVRGTTPADAKPACDYRCGLFHSINAGTCKDPTQAEARKLATQRVEGRYRIVYRFVSGEDKDYDVAFNICGCGATLFEYVRDEDPLPLAWFGLALCVGDMLSIFMIGGGLHWTLACSVPRQLQNRAMTGIILDPNPTTSQVEANKFVLIKLGTAVAKTLTKDRIAALLNNKRDVPDGTLVSARE
jgi:hypothetical protein